ncbi:MAG: FAD binding domain-containing protein [Anaerolineales bacterium]|jgi:hypothetical protein|nr:FAD binding domain-containing protein [Anaerolineales bacterium]
MPTGAAWYHQLDYEAGQFQVSLPESLDEALAATAQHGADAKLLAGGQSLIPAMNFRVMQPATGYRIPMGRVGLTAALSSAAC